VGHAAYNALASNYPEVELEHIYHPSRRGNNGKATGNVRGLTLRDLVYIRSPSEGTPLRLPVEYF